MVSNEYGARVLLSVNAFDKSPGAPLSQVLGTRFGTEFQTIKINDLLVANNRIKRTYANS